MPVSWEKRGLAWFLRGTLPGCCEDLDSSSRVIVLPCGLCLYLWFHAHRRCNKSSDKVTHTQTHSYSQIYSRNQLDMELAVQNRLFSQTAIIMWFILKCLIMCLSHWLQGDWVELTFSKLQLTNTNKVFSRVYVHQPSSPRGSENPLGYQSF